MATEERTQLPNEVCVSIHLKFAKGKRDEIRFSAKCNPGGIVLIAPEIEFNIKHSLTNVIVLRAEALRQLCRLYSDTRRHNTINGKLVFKVCFSDTLFNCLITTPSRIKLGKKACGHALQTLESIGRGCFIFIRD